MEENFSAKRHDATTIKNHVDDDDLAKLKVKIDELNVKVTKVHNALFDSNRRQIESCHKFSHDANEEFLESLKLTRLLAFFVYTIFRFLYSSYVSQQFFPCQKNCGHAPVTNKTGFTLPKEFSKCSADSVEL